MTLKTFVAHFKIPAGSEEGVPKRGRVRGQINHYALHGAQFNCNQSWGISKNNTTFLRQRARYSSVDNLRVGDLMHSVDRPVRRAVFIPNSPGSSTRPSAVTNIPTDLLITTSDRHQRSKTRFKKRITNLHVHPTRKVHVYMQCIQLSLLSVPTLSQSTSCFY